MGVQNSLVLWAVFALVAGASAAGLTLSAGDAEIHVHGDGMHAVIRPPAAATLTPDAFVAVVDIPAAPWSGRVWNGTVPTHEAVCTVTVDAQNDAGLDVATRCATYDADPSTTAHAFSVLAGPETNVTSAYNVSAVFVAEPLVCVLLQHVSGSGAIVCSGLSAADACGKEMYVDGRTAGPFGSSPGPGCAAGAANYTAAAAHTIGAVGHVARGQVHVCATSAGLSPYFTCFGSEAGHVDAGNWTSSDGVWRLAPPANATLVNGTAYAAAAGGGMTCVLADSADTGDRTLMCWGGVRGAHSGAEARALVAGIELSAAAAAAAGPSGAFEAALDGGWAAVSVAGYVGESVWAALATVAGDLVLTPSLADFMLAAAGATPATALTAAATVYRARPVAPVTARPVTLAHEWAVALAVSNAGTVCATSEDPVYPGTLCGRYGIELISSRRALAARSGSLLTLPLFAVPCYGVDPGLDPTWTAGACDTGDPCTVDTCALAPGAMFGFCRTHAYCSDGDACTDDVCTLSGDGLNATCTSEPVACPLDGPSCTRTVCNPSTGVCEVRSPAPDLCDPPSSACEYQSCLPSVNGTVGDGTCTFVARTCDDGNPCTDDSCAEERCINTPRCVSTHVYEELGLDPLVESCIRPGCVLDDDLEPTCVPVDECATRDPCYTATCTDAGVCELSPREDRCTDPATPVCVTLSAGAHFAWDCMPLSYLGQNRTLLSDLEPTDYEELSVSDILVNFVFIAATSVLAHIVACALFRHVYA